MDAAITEELAPGYRAPTLSHVAGALRPSIVSDMALARRVEFVRPDPRLVALSPDGPALRPSSGVARTVEALRLVSADDAAKYPEFCATLERLAAFLTPLLDRTPPSIDTPSTADMWDLLKTGRRFRALGRSDAYRLLRWLPMAVADLAAEWFSNELLQAVISAQGIFGTAAGPWSAGTGAVMLLNAAMDPAPGGSSVMAKGGPGALTQALAQAAREAGADVRVDAPVAQIIVRDGRATGVVLVDGTEITSDAIVSSTDPHRTLLALVDPVELDPIFLQRIRNYRMPGTAAKVNLTLGALPRFAGVSDPQHLQGRLHIGPSVDYLERAFDASKYRQISTEPYLDVAIPSLLDPSLCPEGKHVMSIYCQFAPYKLAHGVDWQWGGGASSPRPCCAPSSAIRRASRAQSSINRYHASRSGGDLRPDAGTHPARRAVARSVVHDASRARLGAVPGTPIDRLFLCGAGTHPGGGITGAPGRNAAREIARALKK